MRLGISFEDLYCLVKGIADTRKAFLVSGIMDSWSVSGNRSRGVVMPWTFSTTLKAALILVVNCTADDTIHAIKAIGDHLLLRIAVFLRTAPWWVHSRYLTSRA